MSVIKIFLLKELKSVIYDSRSEPSLPFSYTKELSLERACELIKCYAVVLIHTMSLFY